MSATAAAGTTRLSVAAPYKGLEPYDDSEHDAVLFKGRETEQKVIAANLVASRLTLLYGASGVGKSSVLRAGVAYQLQSLARTGPGRGPEFAVVVVRDWSADPLAAVLRQVGQRVEELRPGVEPPPSSPAGRADQLEAWSERLGGDLLVILDQFEEYFLYHGHESGDGTFAVEFPQAVNREGLHANFLVSIREDSLAKLDRWKGHVPTLWDNLVRIEHLSREAAKAAIVEPLDEVNAGIPPEEGYTIEPELVDAVLDQVQIGRVVLGDEGRGLLESVAAGDDGAAGVEAPYLQLVMKRLWEQTVDAGGRTLRRQTLRELGEAETIVRTHLDDRMAELSERERELAAGAFQYLVTPSGTKIALTATALADWMEEPEGELADVLEKLSGMSFRILRPVRPADGSEPHYEIYHDVLAKAILPWRAQHVEARRVDEIRREEERKRDEERARFARRLAIVLSVALVCLAGAVAWALVERHNAQGDAKTAEANELATEALSVLPTDPELSLFQAAKAAERAETPAADAALRTALGQSLVRRTITPPGGASSAVVASPDFLVLAPDGSARELGPDGTTVRTLRATGGRVTSAAADRSGRFVVTTDGNGVATVRALDGSRLARLTDRNPIETAAFSPDGTVLATGAVSGGGRLWNWRAGKPLDRLRVDDPVGSIVFSRRGDRVALLSKNGNVDVFERASGRRIDLQALLKGQLATRAVAFGANGSILAGATDDGTVWVAEVGSKPRLVTTLPGSGDGARSIAFNPSGTLVASGGADGSVRVSSPLGGPPVAVLLGHEGPVTSIAFDGTGRTVVTASADGTVRVWDLSLAAPQAFARPTVLAIDRSGLHAVTALAGSEGNAAVWGVPGATLFRTLPARAGALGVSQAAFSDDGTFVVTVGASGLPQLWDWRKGRAFDATAEAGAPAGLLQGVQVSPDGAAVAAIEGVAGTSVARVWRREGSGLTRTATLRTRAPVRALAFSPDGRLLATAAGSGVVLWDWRRTEKVGGVSISSSDRRKPVSVIGVAFSPSGERLLLTGDDGVARVWDRRDGALRAELEHPGLVSSDFGPTDDLVVTAGADGMARVWDVNAKTPVATLYEGTQELAGASIGRDARTIVTIGFDRRARVFRCDACAGSTAELATLASARLAPDLPLLEADAASHFGREGS